MDLTKLYNLVTKSVNTSCVLKISIYSILTTSAIHITARQQWTYLIFPTTNLNRVELSNYVKNLNDGFFFIIPVILI